MMMNPTNMMYGNFPQQTSNLYQAQPTPQMAMMNGNHNGGGHNFWNFGRRQEMSGNERFKRGRLRSAGLDVGASKVMDPTADLTQFQSDNVKVATVVGGGGAKDMVKDSLYL